MYDIYCELRDERGVTDYAVAKACGFNQALFSDWKSGKSVPKIDKLQKIAKFFGVSTSYLIGEEKGGYYLSPETAQIAQELLMKPGLRVLFDAARDADPDDLLLVAQMISRMKGTNRDS